MGLTVMANADFRPFAGNPTKGLTKPNRREGEQNAGPPRLTKVRRQGL
jgi:hypothetical protein